VGYTSCREAASTYLLTYPFVQAVARAHAESAAEAEQLALEGERLRERVAEMVERVAAAEAERERICGEAHQGEVERAATHAAEVTQPGNASRSTVSNSDEKVANRDTKVWHGATETGP
jgi:regulator of replication initiation timing